MTCRWLAASVLALTFAAAGCGADNPGDDTGGRDLGGGRDTGRDTPDPSTDTGPDGDLGGDSGDGGDTDVARPAFSLALDPATLQVQQGASGITTVSIARTGGHADPVDLTLLEPPTGITGTFEPASATGDSSQLTLGVGADVPAAPVALTVRGVSGGLTREATLMVDVQPQNVVDVTVTVLNVSGLPAAGAMVGLDPSARQAADAAGQVTFTQVTRPYDLFVQGAVSSILYRQITTSAPRVLSIDRGAGVTSAATVAGTLSGLPDPRPANFSTLITAGGEGVVGEDDEAADDGTYVANLGFAGPQITASIHGLALDRADVDVPPAAYLGYGTLTRQVNDGDALTGADLSLAPVQTAMLGVDLDLPEGATLVSLSHTLIVGRARFLLTLLGSSPGNQNVLVPVVDGGSFAVLGGATITGGGSQSLALLVDVQPGDTAIPLRVPDIVSVISPASDAVEVALDAPITWTATPDAVHGIQVALPGLGTVIIFSEQPSLDITTLLPARPLSWPASTTVDYVLFNAGPFASVNEAAQAGHGILGPLFALSTLASSSGFLSIGPGSFTTVAPP